MGARTEYTPGTPSWVDLSTPDQEEAKRFYGALFGWEFEDNPIGEDAVYSMARLDGHYVSAVSPQPQQQRDAGLPPMWQTYITVESADEALSEARGLGATVHAGAFDVFDSGRMGVIQDPQGAFFMVWEPKQHIGAGLVNWPGAFTWSELASPDPENAASFYGRLFGWTDEVFENMGTPYRTIQNREGHTIGGIREAASTEPCYWLAYFGAVDLDASLSQVGELGGAVLMDPIDIGVGKLAAVHDAQGAVFALYAGEFVD